MYITETECCGIGIAKGVNNRTTLVEVRRQLADRKGLSGKVIAVTLENEKDAGRTLKAAGFSKAGRAHKNPNTGATMTLWTKNI
jgi:hypothetical protein